jgi:phosphohistidine phosphatase
MSDSITVYLVRHAVAAEAGRDYPDDALRPLTPEGMEKFRKEAGALASMEAAIETVFTSPLVRAKQTAEIIAESLPNHPPVQIIDALAPGGSFADLMGAITRSGRAREIALVGHEPGIGSIAARLIGGSSAIPFKKGAVCRIDVDGLPPDAPGELRWFLTPKLMRLVAG